MFQRSFIAITVFGLFINMSEQELSQFCKRADSTPNDRVLIEVQRIGRGMTWPLIPQVFFRAYDDGRIEFQSREGRLLFIKKGTIDSISIKKLKKLIAADDLADPRLDYPPLERLSDASMRMCVTYPHGRRLNQILIVNYKPDHPDARDYYPASLVELLSTVQQIRPSNDFERKHGFDRLSF